MGENGEGDGGTERDEKKNWRKEPGGACETNGQWKNFAGRVLPALLSRFFHPSIPISG